MSGDEDRIAALLAEHCLSWSTADAKQCRCVCGAEIFTTEADHRAHVAAALTAAGVGDVAAAKAEALAPVKTLLSSEDAHAVLYGVTGTHPESYGGVTKDEALECAGSLLTDLRNLVEGGDA